MKKLVFVAILVGAGWLAYAQVLRPAPKRACARLHELCGDTQPDDDKSCTDFFDTVRRHSDDGDKTAQCVLDAKTCPEAIGCATGGALKIGAGAAKGFLDGFNRSIR